MSPFTGVYGQASEAGIRRHSLKGKLLRAFSRGALASGPGDGPDRRSTGPNNNIQTTEYCAVSA